MTVRRFLLSVATVLTALLVQSTVLTRLPLPGGAPDLLLVLARPSTASPRTRKHTSTRVSSGPAGSRRVVIA